MKNIEIYLENLGEIKSIVIDCKSKKIMINKDIKDINSEDIGDLLRIIRNWDSKYINNNIIDYEYCKIKIIMDNDEEIIECRGAYPDNYNLLKEWISDINERTYL